MIKATIIQDSISPVGKRITTFELEYPRFIHAEFMTHRQFSRNAASSRAIPVYMMHDYVNNDPAVPVYWGKNQTGMQANEEVHDKVEARRLWLQSRDQAVQASCELLDIGLHKQIANRVTEPFQNMKTICTATEFNNWFHLRAHGDAQPEIQELAYCMQDALRASIPTPIWHGEWHVPYVNRERINSKIVYSTNGDTLTEDEAKMVSASCCAQVSYRKNNDSLEKAKQIFDRLINTEPVHASPIEHQATPMFSVKWYPTNDVMNWAPGVTHVNKYAQYCSGNFVGWIQYRQLFSNESK